MQKAIDRANEMILAAPTKEARIAIHTITSALLSAARCYKGFNYVDWYDGGCDAWRKAGEPLDKTPYIGDQTKTFFY